jgi:RNA polymerase sigma-70 factor (ECF subfamily)
MTLLDGRMTAFSTATPSHERTSQGVCATGDISSIEMTTDSRQSNPASDSRVRALVDENYDFIWRSLRGLGVSPGGIDDATQQVFWIAAQKIDTIAPGAERSFLFSTARGIAANLRRARARSPELLDEDAMTNHIDDAPGPEQLASSSQAKQILGRILDTMDDDVRTVFVLFELEGLMTRDIAALLDLAPGTVASRLRRGREEFEGATKRFRASRGGGQ